MHFTELSSEPVVVLPGRSLALMSIVLHLGIILPSKPDGRSN